MTDLNETKLSDLREAFNRSSYPQSNSALINMVYNIHHPYPINWGQFITITIGDIFLNSDNPTIFTETTELNETTLDPVRLLEYKRKLKSEIKFSMLAEHLKLMQKVIGYVKSPFVAPKNVSFLGQNLQRPWNTDLSWLNNNNSSLPDFSNSLNREFFSEFVRFIKYQKQNIRRYRMESKLDDHRLHVDDLLEVRRF